MANYRVIAQYNDNYGRRIACTMVVAACGHSHAQNKAIAILNRLGQWKRLCTKTTEHGQTTCGIHGNVMAIVRDDYTGQFNRGHFRATCSKDGVRYSDLTLNEVKHAKRIIMGWSDGS